MTMGGVEASVSAPPASPVPFPETGGSSMVAAASSQGLRERKKQRTRLRIVDVATRLFSEQGYQQTTLAQIAEEAEVALSTFFNYFPTKPDIVFCLFDSVIE